jgi:small subunit ribosomal protein S8
MSMQDPVADLLTRLRNGHMAKKLEISIPNSKIKRSILDVLHKEGYINGYTVQDLVNKKSEIIVSLKYYKNNPVIAKISRISKPGLRVYKSKDQLPKVLSGLGIAIVSTSKGIVSDAEAKKLGHGGEILCCIE